MQNVAKICDSEIYPFRIFKRALFKNAAGRASSESWRIRVRLTLPVDNDNRSRVLETKMKI